MKIQPVYIKNTLALALVSILGLQFLWLYNMYALYQESNLNLISQNLLQAIEEEFINRHEQLGGPITSTYYPFEKDRFAMRDLKIVAADTTYIISYNAANQYNDQKMKQSSFKYFMPLNIYNLDSIFQQLLIEANLSVKSVTIELYDKENNDTIQTKKPVRSPWLQCYETKTIFVDLADSIGIKAYVQTPYYIFFRQMLLQLILSAVLIVAAMICLFWLSKTIFRQRKEEQIKKDFVNTMTHELKRPITTSLTALEYSIDQISENKLVTINKFLNDSAFELRKLNSYVEKIQKISQGEEGMIELQREDISLPAFFTRLKEKYENQEEKKVFIRLQIEKDLILSTDRLHFSNMMENLIENSIKYSGDSVTIDITAVSDVQKIRITHRDNGWGISSSELPYIFDAFYRGKAKEKRKKSGFGLGLSYVKMMAEQMGGSISVTGKEKEFTEFTLVL